VHSIALHYVAFLFFVEIISYADLNNRPSHLTRRPFCEFLPARKQTLQLSNSIVRDVNHSPAKYGCSVTKSKQRRWYRVSQCAEHNALPLPLAKVDRLLEDMANNTGKAQE